LVDGRQELADDIASADQQVRRYVAHETGLLLAAPRIADGRFGAVVLPALQSIAGAA